MMDPFSNLFQTVTESNFSSNTSQSLPCLCAPSWISESRCCVDRTNSEEHCCYVMKLWVVLTVAVLALVCVCLPLVLFTCFYFKMFCFKRKQLKSTSIRTSIHPAPVLQPQIALYKPRSRESLYASYSETYRPFPPGVKPV